MKRVLSLATVIALLLVPVLAHAAMTTLFVNGTRQGVIEGDNVTAKQENTIVVLALGTETVAPFDQASGQASGRVIPGPVTITKNIDKATPKLFQALVTGETLKDVIIRLYRGASDSSPYFIITLSNARISSMKAEGNAQVSSGVKESISFVWQRMQLTDIATGVTTQIDWSGIL